MSRRLWWVFAATLLVLSLARPAVAELIGHWAFDSTGQQGKTPNSGSAGVALDGKLVGDARLQRDVGDGSITRASALALDGKGDWVRIDHPVTTLGDGHSFTIAAWIKTDAAKMALFAKDDANGNLDVGDKIFFIKEGHGGRDVGFVACGQEWISATSSPVNDGKWHHVAVVYDALLGTKQVMVDGHDVTTETSWRAGPDHGQVVRIGMSDWADAGAFHGHIDDVVVYDQALLPEQIRTLMDKGPQPFDVRSLLGETAGSDPWRNLLRLARIVRQRQQAGAAEAIGVELGSWYCAGPLKDTAEGLHLRSFATVFGPEQQAIAAGREPIDLKRTWPVKSYSGKGEIRYGWTQHPEWTDGYVNPLPLGPPPMKNETCYLVRTITAKRAVSVPMHVFALDNIGAWLNGEPVGTAHNPARSGSSRFAAALMTTLQLRPGENRLLLKITSMHAAHGFAFAMPPLTPSNPIRPGEAHWRPQRFYPGNEPYFGPSDRRYEEACLQQDGIDVKAPPASQRASYVTAILRRLSLPGGAATLLPESDVAALQRLYSRACRFGDALENVRHFTLEIAPTPMYDPARLRMAEVLESSAGSSPAGAAYLAQLDALKPVVEQATAAWEAGGPNGESLILDAARAIDAVWHEQLGNLPPIAFIRCPPFAVNAISPYIAAGAAPAAICVLDPQHPQRPPRVIYDDPAGAIFDMNASYDGRTIFFSARRKGVEGGWHVYEIGVDGSGLKQITRGNSDNISPLLLPGGEIMFVSTRAGNVVVCQQGTSGVLYVCDRDGSNVRRVSGNTLSDHSPQILNDGRVLFTRWDYGVDKNVFARQTPWTMNPDGTRFQLFFGNTIEDPNGFWDARAIPGRPEVVCVFGPHHNYHAGMIGLIWNQLGFEAPRGEGFRWITTEMPSVGDTTVPWGYQDPYPLNERAFLVSFGGDGNRKNRLYLLDDRGNRKCLYEAEGNLGCWNPLPLRARTRPPVLSPASDNPQYVRRDPTERNRDPDDSLTGTFVLQDVYKGLSPTQRPSLPAALSRGEIKAIQIMEQVPRVGTIQGLALFGHWTTISRGTMYVRRIIGTVPVEADGSAHFIAPANRDISLNVLDAEGRAIRRMGSTTQLMPGETVGCIGCHESRDLAPMHSSGAVPAALRREASVPKYPAWTDHGVVDFNRVVQPVLDKYCVECHAGATPEAAVDLTGDKTHFFSMAYDQLLDRGLVHYIPIAGTGHAESSANTRGAMVSRIREYIETDHSGRVLPAEARRRIYTWIDANVPYYGTYEVTDRRVVGGRDRWYVGDTAGWFQKEFVPVFNRRCMPCHQQVVTPQTYNYNPGGDGKLLVSSKLWTDTALSQFQLGHGRISFTGQIGPDHRINLTHPESSQMLTAPLPKKAGGLGLCRVLRQTEKGMPEPFADKNDPDYRAILRALEKGRDKLLANPRVDSRQVGQGSP
ncbi:MAG: hypothetical protein HQ567_21000 [Candidatus Nealsonbacteria bacterium]|nr:hypothetical protein [Candidatus Nealsonbacteria bacterium]